MLLRELTRDSAGSAVVAGFVAMLVGFTSSVVIVVAVAQALGAKPAQTTLWMWTLSLGTGLTHAPAHIHVRGYGGVVELPIESLSLRAVRGNLTNAQVRKVVQIARGRQG